MRVLIIGGYGTFGGRIVELLEDEPRLTLFIAGRSLDRARVFRDARGNARARLVPMAFDRDGDVDARLPRPRPDIVVDASGPFQTYRYRVIEACIAHGINYLDLADDPDFVVGVSAFDAAARAAGVFVLSGASSCPALTAAAVRRLASGMAGVETIRGGIAPSPRAEVGANVIRAIAGYAGQPIRRRRDGAERTGHPFTDHLRFTIAPPGYLPLRSRLFSLVNVPDLRVLAELWPGVASVWMGASAVPEVLHRALIPLAWLARFRLLPVLSLLAPLMSFAMRRSRRGEHRGGMFVAIEGIDAVGARRRRSWHLIAEANDGPYIPAMAVAAIVRKALAGSAPVHGARVASRELELDDFEKPFAARAIVSGVRDDAPMHTAPLYARVLGTAWDRLPAELRAMHNVFDRSSASGRASVERGRGMLARMVGAIVGFPDATPDTPVSVRFDVANGVETWTRTFGGKSFSSRQFAGRGKRQYLLCERFGPLTFAMALVWGEGRLWLVLRGWRLLGISLPMSLGPWSVAYEVADGGGFHFDVAIGHRIAGLIVRYRGWLEPHGLAPDGLARAAAGAVTQAAVR